MITPKFSVSQTDDFVTIVIHAPYIKAQDVDMFVEGPEFKFYLKPYFLRLTFPGNVVEDERSQATYDMAKGDLTVTLAKEEPCQFFPDLDMLTKLLVQKGAQKSTKDGQARRPLIEVVKGGETLEGKQLDKDEEYDWQLPQDIHQEELISEVRYGFNNLYNGFFTHVQETGNDALDVYDPEHATLEQRRANRIEREDAKFDDEYYMSEVMNEEEIQHILKFKTPWWHELRAIQKAEKETTASTPTPQPQASKPSPATLVSKATVVTSTPSSSSSSAPLITPLGVPATSSGTTLTRSSLLNIVPQDEDDMSETTQDSGMDTIGLREVQTRPTLIAEVSPPPSPASVTATATPVSMTKKPLVTTVEDVTMTEQQQTDVTKSASSEIMMQGSGLAHIKMIDPSRAATGSDERLSSSLAQLSLTADGTPAKGAQPFTAKEQDLLRDLPKREYLLQHPKSTYLGLVDILFAYSYNLRVTEGDNTVETPWTICKLAATMAALDQFTTLRETVVAAFRRMLAYPLYRQWVLATKVLQDVYVLLRLGRRGVLRALLAVKDVLDHDDVYYIYSKMFIEDYCVWIQTASEKVLRTLAHELHHFEIQKSEIGWHLDELEALAREPPEESEDEDDDDDDDDDSDTSSDEDTSSEEEDDSSDEEDDRGEGKEEQGNNEATNQDKQPKKDDEFKEESIFMQEGPRPMIIELN
ncbi:Hsp90 cochaperone shq1 [Actinomortierella ambigua]|nr:Hsp90 cochaperone shq1 [Actinomortierella ambigua]